MHVLSYTLFEDGRKFPVFELNIANTSFFGSRYRIWLPIWLDQTGS